MRISDWSSDVCSSDLDKLDKALDAQSASKPLCACRKGATFWFGVKVSFWTLNRMIDVVTEPGCMLALGVDLIPTGGKLQGSQSSISAIGRASRRESVRQYV